MLKLDRILSRIRGLITFCASNRRVSFKHKGVNCKISSDSLVFVGSNSEISDNSSIIIWPKPNENQKIQIGSDFKLERNSQLLSHGGYLIVGNNVFIGPNCQIQGKGGVIIGDGTKIAGNTYIVSSDHDISSIKTGSLNIEIANEILIGKNVWIGAGCIITKGITIGDNTVIGAGSVVTKSFTNNILVCGSPAKKIKDLG